MAEKSCNSEEKYTVASKSVAFKLTGVQWNKPFVKTTPKVIKIS